MLELLLIRHGQTDWNLGDRLMGRQAIPLNEKGRWQAGQLATYLSQTTIDALYTSPVLRARETADILMQGRDACPCTEVMELAEIDYGDLVGMPFAELRFKYAHEVQGFNENPAGVSFPGGESLLQASERVALLLDRIRKNHPDGRVACVSHADVLKLALLSLLKLPLGSLRQFSIDNGALVIVRFHPELGPRLICYAAMNGFGNDL